jgi:hypothetical protein
MAQKRELEDLVNDDCLRSLAMILEAVCSSNADLRIDHPTRFDGVEAPAMSVTDYLARLRRYTRCDINSFLVAITYINRLCNRSVAFCPTCHNIHRLLVSAIHIASKAMDDAFHTNRVMAQCGGLTTEEMCLLESELCVELDWRLQSSAAELYRVKAAIREPHASYWDSWRSVPTEARRACLGCQDGQSLRRSPRLAEKPAEGSGFDGGCDDACVGPRRVASPHSVMQVLSRRENVVC